MSFLYKFPVFNLRLGIVFHSTVSVNLPHGINAIIGFPILAQKYKNISTNFAFPKLSIFTSQQNNAIL